MSLVITSLDMLILAGISFVGALVGGYARKKGEDLATRQGIEKLQNSIESVKLNYQKDFEGFRGDLSLQIEKARRQSHSTEDAMIDLYISAYEMWYTGNCVWVDIDNNAEIEKYKLGMLKYVHDMLKHFFDVAIYSNDSSEATLDIIRSGANLLSWSAAFIKKVASRYEHIEEVNQELQYSSELIENAHKRWGLGIIEHNNEWIAEAQRDLSNLKSERSHKNEERSKAIADFGKFSSELRNAQPLFEYIGCLSKLHKTPAVLFALQAALASLQQNE